MVNIYDPRVRESTKEKLRELRLTARLASGKSA